MERRNGRMENLKDVVYCKGSTVKKVHLCATEQTT